MTQETAAAIVPTGGKNSYTGSIRGEGKRLSDINNIKEVWPMKKLLVLCLSLAMLLTMAAVPAGAEDGVIEINFPTYRVGTNVLAESKKF